MKKNGTRQGRGRPKKNSERADILPDLGITLDQSSQWQRLAAIPEAEFEEAIGQAGAGKREESLGLAHHRSAPKWQRPSWRG
jgi:hypothetical protein